MASLVDLNASAWSETLLCDLCAKVVPHECLMSLRWQAGAIREKSGHMEVKVRATSFFLERRCTNCDKTEQFGFPEEDIT